MQSFPDGVVRTGKGMNGETAVCSSSTQHIPFHMPAHVLQSHADEKSPDITGQQLGRCTGNKTYRESSVEKEGWRRDRLCRRRAVMSIESGWCGWLELQLL